MKKVKEDLTGKVFGRLTVIEQVEDYVSPKGVHADRWMCECKCSDHKRKIFRGSALRYGLTKSCGCLHKEQSSINGKNNKKSNHYLLNLLDEHGEYGIGYCSNTSREFYFDMDDYDKIKDYCWCENKTKSGYCRLETHDKNINQSILMHWIIMDKKYDHADRNPLNNRKYNLRVASEIENARNHNKQKNNTSGFIGVSFDFNKNAWCSYITINKKRKYLGYYESKEDAIIARLRAEKEYFLDFAPQKHLFEKYNIEGENNYGTN